MQPIDRFAAGSELLIRDNTSTTTSQSTIESRTTADAGQATTVAAQNTAPASVSTTASAAITSTPAPPATTQIVRGAMPTTGCTEGTGFGWIAGQPFSPSSATRWSLIIGPIQPGSYAAKLAVGASSFKSNGDGGCAAPGIGGGCGTVQGTADLLLSTTGITVTYTMDGDNHWAIGSHVYYSCSKPAGNEAPGSYPIVRSMTSGNAGPFTLASTGVFPSCPGGYYLMIHASIEECAGAGGPSGATTVARMGSKTTSRPRMTTKAVVGMSVTSIKQIPRTTKKIVQTTSVASSGGLTGCEGTVFGWSAGQPYSPSSATRWSLIIGPIGTGNYSARLALGASSFKNNGNGGCTAPGIGGGCGTIHADADYAISTSGIQVTYKPLAGTTFTKAHVFYSCTKVGSLAVQRC